MRRIVCTTNKFVIGSIAIVSASAVLAYAGSGITSTDVAMVAAIDTSSDTLGIADSQLVWDTPAQQAQALDAMQAMGVDTVRIGVFWGGIELAPGYYNWAALDSLVNAAAARNMGVLAAVTTTPPWAAEPGSAPYYTPPADPQTFGDFTGVLAKRYVGKISAYEVWNEPNAGFFYSPKPDPAGYTQLLKAAYPAIKAADPNATVIGGVLGSGITIGDSTLNPVDFVQQMYAAGAAGSFDALSFHPYQYTTKFSQGGSLANSPINQLTDIRNLMVTNGDANKQIWSTEYGLPTNVVSEQQQADYIQDMVTDWRTLPYAGPAFIYTLRDAVTGSTNDEDNFGVYRTDWTPKAAVAVIKSLTSSAANDPAVALTALTTLLDSSRMVTLNAASAATTDEPNPAVNQQLSIRTEQTQSVDSVAPAGPAAPKSAPTVAQRVAALVKKNPVVARVLAAAPGRGAPAQAGPAAVADQDPAAVARKLAPVMNRDDAAPVADRENAATARTSQRDGSGGAPGGSRNGASSDRVTARPGAHRDHNDAGRGAGDHQRRGGGGR